MNVSKEWWRLAIITSQTLVAVMMARCIVWLVHPPGVESEPVSFVPIALLVVGIIASPLLAWQHYKLMWRE